MVKNLFKTLAVVLVAGSVSCNLAEDLSRCDVEMRLTFNFSRHGEALLAREVPSLSVFAFDASDRLVGRWDEMDAARITADYTMTVPLAPGSYRFVVWGGLVNDNYFLSSPGKGLGHLLTPVVGLTTFDELAVRIKRNTRSHHTGAFHFVDDVPGALFFGSTDPIDLRTGAGHDIDIELVKYSNTINLTVTGLPAGGSTRMSSFPHIDINLHSANGSYTFTGQTASDRTTLTWPQREADHGPAAALTSTIHTLRPVFGSDHKLEFYDTAAGKVIYSADLLDDLIRKTRDVEGNYIYDTQAAVDHEDTYNIKIDLSSLYPGHPTDLGVTVTVNDYHVQSTGNHLD